jgi:uncharacterized membrane protein YhaH (DUF805 family)
MTAPPAPTPQPTMLARPVDPRGRTGPWAYLLAGVFLFATKYAVDHAVAAGLFGRHWSLVEYLSFGQAVVSLLDDAEGRAFYLTMTAIALPYVVVGLALTQRRLRDAGMPRWLVVFFFVPLGNLFFFLSLCLVPSKRAAPPRRPTAVAPLPVEPLGPGVVPLEYGKEEDPALFPRWPVLRWWPAEQAASEFLAVILPIPAVLVLVVLAAHVLRDYGWGLFIGLPFVNGMLAALLHGSKVPRRVGTSIRVGLIGVTGSAAAMFLFALEGLGCLIMFLPLALPIGLVGALLGHAIQARPGPPDGAPWRVGCAAVLALAAWMPAERASAPAAPRFAVTTVVEVDAPPARVWRHVVSFPDLPPPTDWLFRAGVAYPIRAD